MWRVAFSPNIILMDLSMPGVDGWEATRRLKADPVTAGRVIVAVTAHAFPRGAGNRARGGLRCRHREAV